LGVRCPQTQFTFGDPDIFCSYRIFLKFSHRKRVTWPFVSRIFEKFGDPEGGENWGQIFRGTISPTFHPHFRTMDYAFYRPLRTLKISVGTESISTSGLEL